MYSAFICPGLTLQDLLSKISISPSFAFDFNYFILNRLIIIFMWSCVKAMKV